jgi:chromosome partitioning protein
LVDLDPQCNATSALGDTPADHHPLVSTQPLKETLWQTATPVWNCCPAAGISVTSTH